MARNTNSGRRDHYEDRQRDDSPAYSEGGYGDRSRSLGNEERYAGSSGNFRGGQDDDRYQGRDMSPRGGYGGGYGSSGERYSGGFGGNYGTGFEGSARERQQWGGGGQRDWEDSARERGYGSPWQGGPQGGGRGYESGAGYRQGGPGGAYGGSGYGGRYAGSGYGGEFSGSGYGSEFGGQGGWGGAYGAPDMHPGQQRSGSQGQQYSQQQFDPDYHQWRTEQMNNLDEDYRSWRNDRYKKFSDEFSTWRNQRQSNADAETGAASGTSTAGDASSRAGQNQGKSK